MPGVVVDMVANVSRITGACQLLQGDAAAQVRLCSDTSSVADLIAGRGKGWSVTCSAPLMCWGPSGADVQMLSCQNPAACSLLCWVAYS